MPYYLVERNELDKNLETDDEIAVYWTRGNVADEVEIKLGRRPNEDELDDVIRSLEKVGNDIAQSIGEIVEELTDIGDIEK